MIEDLIKLSAEELVSERWEIPLDGFQWDKQELVNWRPPEDMTGCQWAAKYRKLSSKESAEPGDFDPDRTPHTKDILDAFTDPAIDKVAVKKCTQAGVSEAARCAVGKWVMQDPGPCLWVLPDERAARKMFDKHLEPLIKNSLGDYMTGVKDDISLEKIELTTMIIEPAWGGSPSTMAADPRRYVILDDCDDFPALSRRQGDPIKVCQSRVRTYGPQAKVILISSPTTEDGPIHQEFEAIADKRYFHIPCPHCGEWIIPTWRQVKWPKLEGSEIERARLIRNKQLAYYQCQECQGKIEEPERLELLGEGRWISVLDQDEARESREVAFQFSALVNPWANMSDLAATWLTVQGPDKLRALQTFINHELGETFERVTKTATASSYRKKAERGHARLIVPKWAGKLIATADTQKSGHPYMIRAWGHGFKSRLIQWGMAFDLEELFELTINHSFEVEKASEEDRLRPEILLVDSGGGIDIEGVSSTRMVYDFAMAHPKSVIAVKGQGGENITKASSRIMPIKHSRITFKRPGTQARAQVELRLLHTLYYKNILADLITREDRDLPELWEECEEIDDDYCAQMTSEKLVTQRQGTRMIQTWKKVSEGRKNDLWDCAVYQIAGAEIADVRSIEPEAELVKKRKEAADWRVQMKNAPIPERRFQRPDGRPWLSRRR